LTLFAVRQLKENAGPFLDDPAESPHQKREFDMRKLNFGSLAPTRGRRKPAGCERRQRKSPGPEIRGSSAPLSDFPLALLFLGGGCRERTVSDSAFAENDKGVAIFDYALDNRPSTGRGNGRPAVSPTR
jgi:hypothetical protein